MEKQEEKQSLRQAVLFGFLTLLILGLLVRFGVPALIKLAVFLGELRSAGEQVEQKDTWPPPPPVFDLLPEATSSSQLTISGRTEAGAKVLLTVNGIKVNETLADSSGRFVFADVKLRTGHNRLWGKAVDQANNESAPSEEVEIIVDTEPPPLTVTLPKDGDKFFEDDRVIKIEGVSEPDAQVTVNDRVAVIDKDGNFSLSYTLSEGENQLTIKATDKAGNTTEETLTVTYYP